MRFLRYTAVHTAWNTGGAGDKVTARNEEGAQTNAPKEGKID
jgi:hypothetical protein